MSEVFCQFLLALRLSVTKSEIKKKTPLEHLNEYKKVVCPKQYFRKKNSKYDVLSHLYFGPNFVFGDCFRAFQPVFSFFNFSSSANHVGRHFCSATRHKKASQGTVTKPSKTQSQMFMKVLNVPLVFLALSKINAWNLSNINDEKPKLKPEAATGSVL